MHKRLAKWLSTVAPGVYWLLAGEAIGLVGPGPGAATAPMDQYAFGILKGTSLAIAALALLALFTALANPSLCLVIIELMDDAPPTAEVTPGVFDALIGTVHLLGMFGSAASPCLTIGRLLIGLLT